MGDQVVNPHKGYLIDEMALVKTVEISDVFKWLKLGWDDTKAMAYTSLTYSFLFVLGGLYISFGFYHMELPYLILPALSGFLLVGPALAVGFYEGSRRREAGEPFHVGDAFFAFRRCSYPIMGIGVAQVFLFMVWIRLSFTVFAVAFPGVMPEWGVILERAMSIEGLHFGFMITALGAVFAVVIFFSGAFSLPMMIDRKTVLIPAMLTSAYAVFHNGSAMIMWAAVITALMFLGLATGIGLIIVFPLIGHATWHAYKQVIGQE